MIVTSILKPWKWGKILPNNLENEPKLVEKNLENLENKENQSVYTLLGQPGPKLIFRWFSKIKSWSIFSILASWIRMSQKTTGFSDHFEKGWS